MTRKNFLWIGSYDKWFYINSLQTFANLLLLYKAPSKKRKRLSERWFVCESAEYIKHKGSTVYVVHVRELSYILIIWVGVQHFLQDCMCTLRRLRPDCAQADHSFCCPPENASNPWLPRECLRKLWSDCANGLADLSSLGTCSLVGKAVAWLIYICDKLLFS